MAELITNKRHPKAHRQLPRWKSRDGYVFIRDMPTQQLIRTAFYLYSRAEGFLQEELRNCYIAQSIVRGEQASYDLDRIEGELEDYIDNIGEFIEEIEAPEIFKELAKRKIDFYEIYTKNEQMKRQIVFDD